MESTTCLMNGTLLEPNGNIQALTKDNTNINHRIVENNVINPTQEDKKFFFTPPRRNNLAKPNNHSVLGNSTETSPTKLATIPVPPPIPNSNDFHPTSILQGAFTTPLTTSTSNFLKRPLAQPFLRNTRQSSGEQQSNALASPALSEPSFPTQSPTNKKKWFFQSPDFITPSPSSSSLSANDQVSTNTSVVCNDDDSPVPFSFKPTPVMFMFDFSPIMPFFTPTYCFSNHYQCENLLIDGIRYICTEQYYMFYKARVFGDRRAMRQIMETSEPRAMKRIGANVARFDQEKWYKIAIQVMVIASVKKYEQNPTLRRQLFETTGADLIEVNPTDQRWGIGLGMNDYRVRDKKSWRGLNWLGRLLTILRDKLLERPEFASEKAQLLSEISQSFESADSVGCLQRTADGS